MRISICCKDLDTEARLQPWLAQFSALLPGAVVQGWTPGDPPADYAVVWAPPQRFFDEQTRLKAIFNTGAGVDALLGLDLPHGVPLVRLDDAGMAVQMAEYVCHAVIRHFREFDVYEEEQGQGNWALRKPRRRADSPVGVLGLGVLGERVAQALSVFDFPVKAWSRSPRPAGAVQGVECFAGDAGLAGFLAASRVLVCLLPLTPETENILNRQNLSRLQPGGYVINVARGAHLVEEDLLALLDSGRLAGATLDAFRTEPLPPGHAFWTHPKIRVTPHTSARTLREQTIAQIAGKLAALHAGRPIDSIAGVVDREKGY